MNRNPDSARVSFLQEFTARISATLPVIGSRVLPVHAKWQVARFVLAGGSRKCKGQLLIPVGRGCLFLDAQEKADFDTFWEIFVRQDYETNYQGAVVVDVGAHKGCFSAYALLKKARAAFCFEPEERNFAALTQSAASFRAARVPVTIYEAAVAAVSGDVDFYVTNQSWSHSLVPRADRQIVAVKRVRAIALTDIIEEVRGLSQKHPIILKMDIEGAEYDVLMNTRPTVLSRVAEMFVEVHSPAKIDQGQLFGHLAAAGFHRRLSRNSAVWHVVQAGRT